MIWWALLAVAAALIVGLIIGFTIGIGCLTYVVGSALHR